MTKQMKLTSFPKKKAESPTNYVGTNRVDTDPFEELYNPMGLIQPPFRFDRLRQIKEDSDKLSACVAAMQKNVDGFGYRLDFLGDDATERESPDAIYQYNNAVGFFDQCNEDSSFQDVRHDVREDFETLGNASIEIVRFPKSRNLAAAYYMPIVDVRMTRLDEEPIVVTVPLFRDGRIRNVEIKRRFRRFAQVLGDAKSLKWFKQHGDPRTLDAITGEYTSTPKEVATELLWFKQGSPGRPYGIPRWTGNVVDIMGRSMAQYVNYDLFDSQGIPQMLIVVENGTLSDESREELRKLFDSFRGVENFNRAGLLEAIPELQGLDDKSNVKVTIKNLTEYRSNDAMFKSYLEHTGGLIREAFRISGIYLGEATDLSYAGAYSAQKLCEEQVFIPERIKFDQVLNSKLLWGELKCNLWQYKTVGPKIVSAEELRLSLKEFAAAGAITVNWAIEILNEMFGLSVSKYNEEWADQPVILLKTMANNGTFVLEDIKNAEGRNTGSSFNQSETQRGRQESTSEQKDPPIEQPTQKS